MKILVFDTETTGLPTSYNTPVIATQQWPYIVQLSYIIYDTELNTVLDYRDTIIKLPNSITITKESENIHKISNEMSKTKGVELKPELIKFNELLNTVDEIVGHNISFDKNMIMVECLRFRLENNFTKNKIPEFCTMKNSVNICKILTYNKSGRSYYKYPKLIELYQYLFNTTPDGLHNSMVDVLATIRCYGKLKYNIDYNEFESNLNTLKPLIP